MSASPRPRPWAVAIVHAATLQLPPGDVRRRYRRELVSELWGMSVRQQLRHATSLLIGAPRLRRALFEAGELEFPHSPLWCRLQLHHRWHTMLTEDGTRYRRCLACGADDDETSRRRVAGSMGIAHGTTIG
jgi:hypothetical protein